ncbi:MAG: MBL fold metallo-hydrolase [Clostridia bacterium]|nr:MBL fold metallo-hydrolase [Clostridia bacterium]
MNVTWITQGGLLFETERITVMVDPYLSNSVAEKLDPSKQRRIPVDESIFDIKPDVIIITHDHLDHLDPDTLERFLSPSEKPITVLAPLNAYKKLLEFGNGHNYVLLSPHSVWSEGGLTFYAVSAAHSDIYAAGYIIDDGERTYYVSGDTLYNYDVIDDVIDLCEDGVDYAFLPVNGVGNNMNMRDAADFACEIGAKCAVPIHWGLFDDLDPAEFDFDNSLVLKPYVKCKLS